MNVSEILNKAADLVSRPGGWIQEAYALNCEGEEVDATSEEARCFCTLGAIRAAGKFPDDVNPVVNFLASTLDNGMVCDWNDDFNRTQAEVVNALREAAKRAAA